VILAAAAPVATGKRFESPRFGDDSGRSNRSDS